MTQHPNDPLHGITLEMMLNRLVEHYGCPNATLNEQKRILNEGVRAVMTSMNKPLEYFNESHGWREMGRIVKIRCFNHEPSIKSSLYFLRRCDWARKKVEDLYRGIHK